MRIVLATHRTNEWLGINKYFYLLGKYLARLGVDVKIIVDSERGVEIAKEIAGDLEVVQRGPTASGLLSTVWYCDGICAYLLKETDFDILHCGHVLPFFYLTQPERKPVVFQPFGNELFTLAGRGLNKWYCRVAQRVLRYCTHHADVVVSEGTFQHKEMAEFYPKMKELRVLPVGVETDGRMVCTRCESPVFTFLAVNSLLPYEGMDELIKAFSRVSQITDCRLIIVGSGSEETRLKKMATSVLVEFRQGLSEAELRGMYLASDAFVCTTHETDFQMGVLEAMASGLPVISRNATWLPDSVMRFREDGSDLAEKMLSLATKSGPNRTQVAERGLEEVRQYSFTGIAQKAIEIYSEILGNR